MHMRKKNWDLNILLSQIRTIEHQCCNPYNDGYTSFEIKKDLYLLKEAIDSALQSSPTFTGEDEWLHKREQIRVMTLLKS